MATQPVNAGANAAIANALIAALRANTPVGSAGNVSTWSLLTNRGPGYAMLPPAPAPRGTSLLNPVVFAPGPLPPPRPAPAPAPNPPPPAPPHNVVLDPVVLMPDDSVDPPAPNDDVVQTFPVSDPALLDAVDLPPLPPSDGEPVDPTTDDPTKYDEIPEGEIDVGPPGNSQPARDAIANIGNITNVGNPLDELGLIDLLIPKVTPPTVTTPTEDDTDQELQDPPQGTIEVGPPGNAQKARDAIQSIGNITNVGNPLDELGLIELLIPEIDPPEVPEPEQDPQDLQDPPQGVIEVGPPGNSQAARDAIANIGNITNVGNPLDELPVISLPIPNIDPPEVPEPAQDPQDPQDPPQGIIEVGPPGSSQGAIDAINNIGSITNVGNPVDELDLIYLPIPKIEPPEVLQPAEPKPDQEAQDPPQGQIVVVPPGDSQPASDAIANIGNITNVGSAADELDVIYLPVPDIAPTNAPVSAPAVVDMPLFAPTNTIATVDPVTNTSIDLDDLSTYVDMLNTDITSTLPPAVAAPSTPQQLTDQELFEMALFQLLSQQLLTRGAPGMTDEETVNQ